MLFIQLEITSFNWHLPLLIYLNCKYAIILSSFSPSFYSKRQHWHDFIFNSNLRFDSTKSQRSLLTLPQSWLAGTIQLQGMESMVCTGCSASMCWADGCFKVTTQSSCLKLGAKLRSKESCTITYGWKLLQADADLRITSEFKSREDWLLRSVPWISKNLNLVRCTACTELILLLVKISLPDPWDVHWC